MNFGEIRFRNLFHFAGNYLMFMDILMASWKSELNLLGRDREGGIEIYLHALQVSIIRVKSVEPLS